MKNAIFLISIILLTLTGCQSRESVFEIEEQTSIIEILIQSDENKSISEVVVGDSISLSGTSFGYNQVQCDSMRYIGNWGSPMSTSPNISAGRKNIKCWYKRNGLYTRFYPDITLKVINPDQTTTYTNLRHVVVRSTPVADSTGYSAEMYYEMVTEFDLSFNQGGLVVNPLTNSEPFISVKIEYSGIADSSLTWPDSTNVVSYNELGSTVSPGEQLYVITTYNDLRGERKLPMNYNSASGKWEFEFSYLPNAGLNFRVEKATTQALFMGVRLSTSLGEVSCSNIHYFPDSFGENTWSMFETYLENGIPKIPYPGINQLVNILQLIIGG